jgi:hypothetical protein
LGADSPLEEAAKRPGAFFLEHRAHGVDEMPPGPHPTPGFAQKLLLDPEKAIELGLTPEPANVGMTA